MGTAARDVVLGAEMIRNWGDTGDSENNVAIESDSEGEVIQPSGTVLLPRGVQRVEVPGFSKRTYGGDVAAYAKLDAQLENLRAVLPNVVDATSRGKERASVVLDAYHYIATLQREVKDLNAELELGDRAYGDESSSSRSTWSSLSSSCYSGLRWQPMVEVARRDGLLQVCIVCVNRPGLLVDVMEAVESKLGLSITQVKIACHNEIVVEYLSLENEEILGDQTLLTSESQEEKKLASEPVLLDEEEEERQVKAILIHAICCPGANFGSEDLLRSCHA